MRNEIPEWSGRNLNIALDMHCPYVNATTVPRNETVFFVGSSKKNIAAEQKKFMDILESNKKGELHFSTNNSYMPYGIEWNQHSKSSQGDRFTFTRWATETFGNILLVSTIEFPFAHNDGQMVTPDNARDFGRDLAHAMAVYLQMSVKR